MHLFEADGKSYPLDQLTFELPQLDLIHWLARQTIYPKVFWKEKGSHVIRAAVGNLLSFSHAPTLPDVCPFDVRLYGGMRFAPKTQNDEAWKGFPTACFWLPQIEISQENEKSVASINYLNEKSSLSDTKEFDFTDAALEDPIPSFIKSQNTPDSILWREQVGIILDQISSGMIDKVVLARKSSFYFTAPLSPWTILAHLNKKAKQATVFAFQLSPRLCFLGATPEKLFHRNGDHLQTDAIAATRPRGNTPEEDQIFEQELLHHPKELKEFQFVVDFLQTSLLPLSQHIRWEWPQGQIFKASHVQHLHNRLSAILKPGCSDDQLIRILHPTPALGGTPQTKALALLKTIESFDRGWYGSPIGIIGSKRSCLYVGIRSGLIQERSLHLFAGTGLVQGSVAEREWEELEQKIRPFTELFHL